MAEEFKVARGLLMGLVVVGRVSQLRRRLEEV